MASSTPSSNRAAWLPSSRAHPFQISSYPILQPTKPNEILIRNHALAINPIDYKLQTRGFIPLTYPAILGSDIAGTVIAVGPGDSPFSPGDRVLSCTPGFVAKRSEYWGFQEHTLSFTDLTAKIPDTMSFEDAVAMPLGVATAAVGLFQDDFLGLRLPTTSAEHTQTPEKEQVVLISGGASSVGGNAVQLAAAAGYTVLTTCSAKNFDAVKALGASAVFDYSLFEPTQQQNHSDLVTSILDAIPAGAEVVGAFDAVGQSGWAICAEFVTRAAASNLLSSDYKNGKNLTVVTAASGCPHPGPHGVVVDSVFAMSAIHTGVGEKVFRGFLDGALEKGEYKAWPKAMVVGKGLESVQDAVDLMGKGGLSANKIVVTL